MKRYATLIVFMTLLATSQPAGADRTFRFIGGGNGHGVGMSQYGAYGLAQKGWGRKEIITWYYKGTSVGTEAAPKGKFRVGLLQRRGSFTLKARKAAFDLVVEGQGTVHTVPKGEARRIVISGEKYKVYKDDKLKGTWGGPADDLRAVYRDTGALVKVRQWGHGMRRGHLEWDIVSSTRAHLVAVIDPEEYLFGLGEVPSSWPAKVLQVQADAARTYAYRVVDGGGRSGCACDIYGDTRDQNYVGWEKESSYLGERWVSAVEKTEEEVVTYSGGLAKTYYSSSSGGWIEAVGAVWGGSEPYLKATCDPGDYTSANPNRTWKKAQMGKEVARKLRARYGWSIRRATGITITDRGKGGYVSKARITGKRKGGGTGSWTASGEQLRVGLGLKSARFWVNRNRNVRGAIRTKYDALRCSPGLPRSGRAKTAGGVWQRFKNGRIYSKDGVGTRYLHGLVLGKYLDKRGPAGRLGYPKTDVRKLSDGRLKTRFQGGRIICTPSSGRCKVAFT